MFEWEPAELSFAEILEEVGAIPLPPYMNREAEADDLIRYQTIFAQQKGSVAAPTAGLHFTEVVFQKIKERNIEQAKLTLHVGAGTFKPVKTKDISQHEMHTEHFSVDIETLNKLAEAPHIISVGTTSARALESLYWIGLQMIQNPNILQNNMLVRQWEPYTVSGKTYTRKESMQAILAYLQKNKLDYLNASTQLMIVPGYTFRMTDTLITNFHQPGSTLLLLVSAFIGNDWKKVYEHALKNNYRFLSYGDSCLFLK